MKNPQTQSTTSYGKFKNFDSNRDINGKHITRLKASIEAKNLLHLFPIVVNNQMEVIDGQHRLQAAKELKVPVYYIVDSDVTKADIAMVNNNRKGWSARDYINFYVKEGYPEYKDLDYMLKKYPVTIIGAVRLMKKGSDLYWQGGGRDSAHLKAGTITNLDFKLAKGVCEIAAAIQDKVPYIFRPDLLMEIKSIAVKNGFSKQYCLDKLVAGKMLFPKESFYYDPQASKTLREILLPIKTGYTADEVAKMLKLK